MKLKTWQNSLLLAMASYIVCILAQAIPNFLAGTPPLLFPTDTYNQIELLGFISGVVGVYLMVKQSVWNYPIGLIWAVAYAIYFFNVAKHFGEASVMLINAGYLIDGWIKWAHESSNLSLSTGEGVNEELDNSTHSPLPTGEGLREGPNESELQISHLKPHNWMVIGITLAIAIPLLISLLLTVRGNFVYFDAATTALALTAQYLTNRKVFESWYFWIAANVVIIPVFIYRQYYPTAILYAIFTVMAFQGIKEWRESMNSQHA